MALTKADDDFIQGRAKPFSNPPHGYDDGGTAIEVEVWELSGVQFGSFVYGIPAPLGIGRTLLADGSSVAGFICEPSGLDGARDITAFGGWRAYKGR